jgi:parvulin-like peptidyl-prolyl isomerase
VNGRPIPAEKVYTVYQMNKEMLARRGRVLSGADDQALRAQSLEAVVADELLYQAAKAKGFKAGAAELDEALKQLKLRVGSDAAYRTFLAESGFTEASVRNEVERKVMTEAYQKSLVAGKGGVTDEQVKQFYEANVSKGMFNAPEQVHVQYILVRANEKDPESVKAEARKRVDEAAKRATAGEDFAALAKEYSQDVSASRGGDVGLIPRGVTFPEFEAVAFSTKPGEVSAVFETPKGFNVMKILEKKPESTRTYDEVKAALKLDMGRLIEQDVLKAKVQELAAGAKIELLDATFAIPGPQPPTATAKR